MPVCFHSNISHCHRCIIHSNDRHNLLGPQRYMNTVCLHERESVSVSAYTPTSTHVSPLHISLPSMEPKKRIPLCAEHVTHFHGIYCEKVVEITAHPGLFEYWLFILFEYRTDLRPRMPRGRAAWYQILADDQYADIFLDRSQMYVCFFPPNCRVHDVSHAHSQAENIT